MDQFTTPTVQQDMLDDSSQFNTSVLPHTTIGVYAKRNDVIANVVALVICVLGIPGNVLVVAVYVQKMTTSIRMYMFALAVVDLVTCVYGIVIATATFGYVGTELAKHCAFLTLSFSSFLLVFVSVERLLAVRHPNTFSLSLSRAKRALVAITVAAVISAVVQTIARVIENRMLLYGCRAIIIVACAVVMIVCYSLMGITVVLKERAAHSTVGIASSAPLPGPSTMSAGRIELSTVSGTTNTTSCKHEAKPCIKSTTAIKPNTLKNMYLLFMVTFIFLVSWIPLWVNNVGFETPLYARRAFFLNSLVNPYIYSVMSRMFRTDVQQFCRKVHTKLITCQP